MDKRKSKELEDENEKKYQELNSKFTRKLQIVELSYQLYNNSNKI